MGNNAFQSLIEKMEANGIKVSKMAECDKQNVVDTANYIIENICKISGMDPDKLKVTTEDLDKLTDTVKTNVAEMEKKCNKVRKNCQKKLKNVTDKEERKKIIDKANSIMKDVLTSFGMSEDDMKDYNIDESISDDDKVYINVAKPDSNTTSITITNVDENDDKCDGCTDEACECACDDCDLSCADEETCKIADKDFCTMPKKETNAYTAIKDRLKKEYSNKKCETYSPDMLTSYAIDKVYQILADETSHNYIYHEETPNSPAVVECRIVYKSDAMYKQTVGNLDVLLHIREYIKETYGFDDVYITNGDNIISVFCAI